MDAGPPSRTNTAPLEEGPSDYELIGDRGTAPGEDPGEEVLASVIFFVIIAFYLFTMGGLALRTLNANQMWTAVLGFFVSSFVYFGSGIEAPGGSSAADDEPSGIQYITTNGLAILHSTVYGLLSFAVFIVADTSFFPPVPLPDRFKLMVALATLMTAGMLLWMLFAVVHGRGLPRGVIRVIIWCRDRLKRSRDAATNISRKLLTWCRDRLKQIRE
jgi:hypothetical protein